jgi:hypothetical protein
MDICGNFKCKRYNCLEDNNCKKWNIIVACTDYTPLKEKTEPVAEVPCSDGLANPLAYVGLGCGRQYLKVAGVIVAVEGDICRDPMIPDEYRHQREEHHLKWMPEMLEYAARTINEKVG